MGGGGGGAIERASAGAAVGSLVVGASVVSLIESIVGVSVDMSVSFEIFEALLGLWGCVLLQTFWWAGEFKIFIHNDE